MKEAQEKVLLPLKNGYGFLHTCELQPQGVLSTRHLVFEGSDPAVDALNAGIEAFLPLANQSVGSEKPLKVDLDT